MIEKAQFGYNASVFCFATLVFIVIGLPPSSMKLKGVDAPAEAPLTILMNVSGFCKEFCCCGVYADGVTASGQPAEGYFVAAPPEYPFGTEMVVPGYNNSQPVKVLDRGGAIKNDKLDVFFEDKDGVSGHQRALNWGRQYLNVEVKSIK
jgi:3D (Asp-Asp-Asp) domain-containing protein